MDQMIEMDRNEKRRHDILDVVASLSAETHQKLNAWADAVCEKYNAMPVPQGEEAVYMSRNMAIELIMTVFTASDWWPERTNDWLEFGRRCKEMFQGATI